MWFLAIAVGLFVLLTRKAKGSPGKVEGRTEGRSNQDIDTSDTAGNWLPYTRPSIPIPYAPQSIPGASSGATTTVTPFYGYQPTGKGPTTVNQTTLSTPSNVFRAPPGGYVV